MLTALRRWIRNWIDVRHQCVECGGSTRVGYLVFHDGTRKCLPCCGITRKDIADYCPDYSGCWSLPH